MNETQQKLAAKCDELKALLIRKNEAYGNSALDPVRVFSTVDATEQLRVRLDDKLSRLARGTNHDAVPEDTLMDLCGYLILLMVAQGNQTPKPHEHHWVETTEIRDSFTKYECSDCGQKKTGFARGGLIEVPGQTYLEMIQ